MPAKNAKSLFVPSNQKTAHPYPMKVELYIQRMVAQGVIKLGEFNSGVDLIDLINFN